MKSSKVLLLAGMFVALMSVSFSLVRNTAHADNCDLTAADLAQITAIQNDPTLTASQELTKELAMRKQLITKTVTCAQLDVQTLQTSLLSTTVDSDSTDIKSQLSDQLNTAAGFYTRELTKLNTAGIAGTEGIAREILAWRKSTYVPLEGQVNNFVLWSGNQSLFTTAQSRMDQTQRAVSFIESAAENNDLENAFNAARISFQNAKDQNESARAALAHFLPPDQSLALIKQSLDSLSDTYQKFFAVSDGIKALLPQ